MIHLTTTSFYSNCEFFVEGRADTWDDIDRFVRRLHAVPSIDFTAATIAINACSQQIEVSGFWQGERTGFQLFLDGHAALPEPPATLPAPVDDTWYTPPEAAAR